MENIPTKTMHVTTGHNIEKHEDNWIWSESLQDYVYYARIEEIQGVNYVVIPKSIIEHNHDFNLNFK